MWLMKTKGLEKISAFINSPRPSSIMCYKRSGARREVAILNKSESVLWFTLYNKGAQQASARGLLLEPIDSADIFISLRGQDLN